MTNEQAMTQYKKRTFKTPDGYTSDIAIFTIVAQGREKHKPPVFDLNIMLIKRSMKNAEGDINIEAGKWALPGGFVEPTETAYQAAVRELKEETGVQGIHLKHYGVFDKPGRDPRGWIITNAHYAIVPEGKLVKRKANDDAEEVKLFPIEELSGVDLAFDHEEIIQKGIREIKKDLLQSTVAKDFLPEKFTYSELQSLLATVTNDAGIMSDQSFSRKIKTLPFIEEVTGEATNRTSKKPAKLYSFIEMDTINPIYTSKY